MRLAQRGSAAGKSVQVRGQHSSYLGGTTPQSPEAMPAPVKQWRTMHTVPMKGRRALPAVLPYTADMHLTIMTGLCEALAL